jgi:hypothetical protein
VLAVAAVVVPLWLRARGKARVLQQLATDED